MSVLGIQARIAGEREYVSDPGLGLDRGLLRHAVSLYDNLESKMKRRSKPGRDSALPNQKGGLPIAERAELQRQGAKAAARGEERGVNPMDEQTNRPSTTGECPDVWQRRKDAWQEGHDVQSRAEDHASTHPSERGEKDDH